MTTVHPIQGHRSLPQEAAWFRVAARSGLFFEPGGDGGARDAEGAAQATKTAPLLVGTQNFIASLGQVTLRRRVLPVLSSTCVTAVTLLPVWRLAIFDERLTLAEWAVERDRDHHRPPNA
jgi:hypothetical protein